MRADEKHRPRCDEARRISELARRTNTLPSKYTVDTMRRCAYAKRRIYCQVPSSDTVYTSLSRDASAVSEGDRLHISLMCRTPSAHSREPKIVYRRFFNGFSCGFNTSCHVTHENHVHGLAKPTQPNELQSLTSVSLTSTLKWSDSSCDWCDRYGLCGLGP